MIDINNIYKQINSWINQSNGNLIKTDENFEDEYYFDLPKEITEESLIDFEKRTKVKLPLEYKNFLINIGAVELFSRGIEILNPEKVEKFSQIVFNNSGIEDPYPNLFLAVSIPVTGYVGGFDLTNENPENNFAIFFADVPPELWLKEAEFTSFNSWLTNLVLSNSMELF